MKGELPIHVFTSLVLPHLGHVAVAEDRSDLVAWPPTALFGKQAETNCAKPLGPIRDEVLPALPEIPTPPGALPRRESRGIVLKC